MALQPQEILGGFHRRGFVPWRSCWDQWLSSSPSPPSFISDAWMRNDHGNATVKSFTEGRVVDTYFQTYLVFFVGRQS